jgi:hypothetical protein
MFLRKAFGRIPMDSLRVIKPCDGMIPQLVAPEIFGWILFLLCFECRARERFSGQFVWNVRI